MDLIKESLDTLQRRIDRRAEVIVVDGDAEGTTINEIQQKDIITMIAPKGRARQMNAAAAHARSDILVFLHIDSELPENALDKMKDALERHPAGAFDVTFVGPRLRYRILSHTVSLRARLTRVPYGDQTLFFRRAYFEELGGFAEIPIMEDVEIMQRIRRRGDRIAIIRDRVKTSARRWEAEGPLFTMIRNPILSFLFRRGVPAEKLARYYKSGRLVYREQDFR